MRRACSNAISTPYALFTLYVNINITTNSICRAYLAANNFAAINALCYEKATLSIIYSYCHGITIQKDKNSAFADCTTT
ncbi:MAG: hypothetical protein ACXQS3_06030 [Candidatus Methanofastidiosia archaeon]